MGKRLGQGKSEALTHKRNERKKKREESKERFMKTPEGEHL
jgi:hypothetical protein